MFMLVLGAVLALAIGVLLGLLGGGGSILTVPMLVYALGVDAREAVPTSLLVVGATAAAGMLGHARAGQVAWRVGATFGAAGMVSAFAAGRVARVLPAATLMTAFSAVMLLAALAMLRGRREPARPTPPSLGKSLGAGAVAGAIAGLVGAGGGFVVVPALALFGGLALRQAIGTSLLVIALQSAAGLLGQLGAGAVRWELAGVVAVCSVAGSLAGVRLSRRVATDGLRQGFAWLVMAVALAVLADRAPAPAIAAVSFVLAFAVWAVARTAPAPARPEFAPVRGLRPARAAAELPWRAALDDGDASVGLLASLRAASL